MAQQNRTVLITGAAKGIGKAIAKQFATAGFNVAIVYRQSKGEAMQLVSDLLSQNVNCAAFACDVSDYKAVECLYKAVTDSFGFVDTVINNAAVSHYKLFSDESSLDFDEVIGTNLKGTFSVCRMFCKDMVSRKFGRIINISSCWGQTGAAMEVLYSASKAGVIGLTKALAAELALSHVTVNAIAPGIILTDMNAHLAANEITTFLENVPAAKMGCSDDVAAAALYLAGESAAYVTGQILAVNGGLIR